MSYQHSTYAQLVLKCHHACMVMMLARHLPDGLPPLCVLLAYLAEQVIQGTAQPLVQCFSKRPAIVERFQDSSAGACTEKQYL